MLMIDLDVVDIPKRLSEGMKLMDKGAQQKARALFEDYLEVKPDSALALSFAGMLEAQDGKNPTRGLERCLEAMRKDPSEALCYLNAAKAYIANNNRYQAIRALAKGLKIHSPNLSRLRNYCKIMGIRRKPFVRFLSRDNPVNNLMGRITWKIKKPS